MTSYSSLIPTVIAVAPTGSRPTKQDHPALPITAEDLADTAAQCQEVGASVVHMHVRDGQGRHSLNADDYRAAIRAVRRTVRHDMLIQVTAESGGLYPPQQQMAVVRDVQPEAVTLPLDELLPDASGLNDYANFLAELDDADVLVQHQLCTPDEVRLFCDLRRRGAVPDRCSVLFLLGAAGRDATPRGLLEMLAVWQDRVPWMVAAFGPRENACAMAGVALGGHARVGFENNFRLGDGRMAADNAALVLQLAKGLAAIGCGVADVAMARRILAGGA